MPNSDPTLVTTTVQLPIDLWTRARTRAAEQRENLRAVLVRALERELARPAKPPRTQRTRRAAKTAMAALLFTGALLGGALVTPAFAWNEPDSFLGVPWGAPRATAQAAVATAAAERNGTMNGCRTLPSGPAIGATSCRVVRVSIGHVVLSASFLFAAEGFYWAAGSFPSSQYELVRATFVEKYGEPTSTETTELSNRVGGHFTNESLEWVGEKTVIHLYRYGSTVTDGSFELITRAENDKRTERLKTLQQKGKGAL